MPKSTIQKMRSLPLFRNMRDKNYELLMQRASIQTFPALVDLIKEGAPSEFLHVVLSGSVSLHSTWNERETSMATVRPVSTFILAATIKDAPNVMSAETLEPSRIALLPNPDVRAIFEMDSGFAVAVVNELAENYRLLVKTTKDLKLRMSLERLANYLLRQHNQEGGAQEFELSMKKHRLASFLGMKPESLSRAFRKLKDHGVSTTGEFVTILDRQALEDLANPNPLIDDYSI